MDRTIQDLKSEAGADMAPQDMPEQIRITLLATVTGRLIEMRRQGHSADNEYELSRLVPAIEWLTSETEGGDGAKH